MNSETNVVDANFSLCTQVWSWSPTSNEFNFGYNDDVMVSPLTAVEYITPPPTEDIFPLGQQDDYSQLTPMASENNDKLCPNTIFIDGEVNGSPVLSRDPNLFSAAEMQDAEELGCFDPTTFRDDNPTIDIPCTPTMARNTCDENFDHVTSPLIPSPAQIPCAFCERKFTTKGNLTRHNRTVHPDKCYESLPKSVAKTSHFNGRKYGRKVIIRLSAGKEKNVEEKLLKKFRIFQCEVRLERLDVEEWFRRHENRDTRTSNVESNFPKMIHVARKSKPSRGSSETVENNLDSMDFTPYGDDVVNEVVIGEESIGGATNKNNEDQVSGCGLRIEPKRKLFAEMIETEIPKSNLQMCDTCGMEFSAKACLLNHKKFTHANNLGPKLKCEACGDEFCVINQYSKHITTCKFRNGKNGMTERNLFDNFLNNVNKSLTSTATKSDGNASLQTANKSTTSESNIDETVKLKTKRDKTSTSTESGYYRKLANGCSSKTTRSKGADKKDNSVQESSKDCENGSEESVGKLKDMEENRLSASATKLKKDTKTTRRTSDSKIQVRRKRVFQDMFESDESSDANEVVDDHSDVDFELKSRKQRTKKQPNEKQEKRKVKPPVDASKNTPICDTPVPAKRPRGRPRKTEVAVQTTSTSSISRNTRASLAVQTTSTSSSSKNNTKTNLAVETPSTAKNPVTTSSTIRQKSQGNENSPSRTLPNRRVKEGLNFAEDDLNDVSTRDVGNRVNATSRLLKCHDCAKTFLHANSVVRHRASRHCHEALQCALCFLSVSQEREHIVQHMIIQHLKTIQYNKDFVETLIDASTENKTVSMLEKELDVSYCNGCKNLFPTLAEFVEHRTREKIENPFKCGWCSMLYKSEICLRSHQCKHPPYHCRWCKKEYKTVAGLTLHQSKHKLDEENKLLNNFIPDGRTLSVVLDKLPLNDIEKAVNGNNQQEGSDINLEELDDIEDFFRSIEEDENGKNKPIESRDDSNEMAEMSDDNAAKNILDELINEALERNGSWIEESVNPTGETESAPSENGVVNAEVRDEDEGEVEMEMNIDEIENLVPAEPTVAGNVNGGQNQRIQSTLGLTDCFSFVV